MPLTAIMVGIVGLVAITTLLLSSIASSQNYPSTAKHEFLTYYNNATSKHYGIRINYPSDWDKKEEVDVDNDVCSLDFVDFTSPPYGPKNNTAEFYIALRLYDNDSTPKDLKEELEFEKNYKDVFDYTHFKTILSNSKSILAGKPAYKLVWTGEVDGVKEKGMEIGTIIGGDVYFINYEAEAKTFSHYESIIQKMIDSFRLEKPSLTQTKYFLPNENSAYGITKITHIKCLGVPLP